MADFVDHVNLATDGDCDDEPEREAQDDDDDSDPPAMALAPKSPESLLNYRAD
jgi:hypothetical protein